LADGILITDIDKKKSSKTLKYSILAALVLFIFLVIIFSGDSKKTVPSAPKPVPTQAKTTNQNNSKVNSTENVTKTPIVESSTQNVLSDEKIIENAQRNAASVQYEPYVIKKGDCLTKIAKELYGASIYWTQILDKNKKKIEDPDKIFAGQIIMVPVISEDEPQWDTAYLVETYVETYKIYKELERVESVKFMLSSGVKRIDSALVEHYKQEIKKYNKAYASPTSMLGNPSP